MTEHLPTLNAILNATSGTLVVLGWLSIRKKRVERHRALMLTAVGISALFLISYLTYHSIHGSTRYSGRGFLRAMYLTILLTHSVAAAAVVPMVIVTLRRALTGRLTRHRRIARWTLPVWLYASVTGVIVYLMLYRI